jgi:hypothetical protein
MARKTRQVETRMVSEYLLSAYAQFPTRTAVPLGKVSESLMAFEGYQRAIGLSRPYRPEVDAIVFLPNYLVIIEAKVWQIMFGLAKLPMYKDLVPATPELSEYKNREVIMELVVGWTNDNLEMMAKNAGIRVRVFCPDWLKSVVDGMHMYWTADYARERQRKLEMRQNLGLD